MTANILLKKGRDKWIEKAMDFADLNHLENYLRKMESYGYKDMGTNIINSTPKQK